MRFAEPLIAAKSQLLPAAVKRIHSTRGRLLTWLASDSATVAFADGRRDSELEIVSAQLLPALLGSPEI